MPAYNAEQTLEESYRDLPKDIVDGIILVDDASRDRTVEVAKRLGLTVIVHETNLGYGGNQKTCYREALKRGADIVVMVHPDNQYKPGVVPYMVGLVADNICDVVLGNRIRTRAEALGGGMPMYKYIANRFLTILENGAAGQNLGEWHSGLRAYSREALEKINFDANSNDFVFDQQFLFQAAAAGLRLGDVPVPVRYFKEASSISFIRSVKYGFDTLGAISVFLLNRLGLLRSAAYTAPAAAGKNREGA